MFASAQPLSTSSPWMNILKFDKTTVAVQRFRSPWDARSCFTWRAPASMMRDGSEFKIPHVMSVAGSDSGAGAGIQADLKTCAARGVYCSTVITAVTAQNTVGVQGVHILLEDFVAKQMKAVLSDMQVDVVKTGMIPSVGIAKVLLQCISEFPIRALVVDPVMVSTSGDVLAGSSILPVFHNELLPTADIVTANLVEASALLGGVQMETIDDMKFAAKSIYDMGPRCCCRVSTAVTNAVVCVGITVGEGKSAAQCRGAVWQERERGREREGACVKRREKNSVWIPRSIFLTNLLGMRLSNVLVKGGGLPASLDAVDIFFDGKNLYELSSARINTRNTHGTGCALASCIAAELAKGSSMLSAVKVAKHFIETALIYSKDIEIGGGLQGPFDHLLKLKNVPHRSLARCLFSPEKLLLYAVTDSGMNEKWGRSITDAVKAAIEGGATIVQLREKNLETREFLEAATACVAICRSKGVPLLINDRVDIALACDADGVHIGQSDMPTCTARCLLGSEKIIGVSCQTPEQAHRAWIDGADYIGCGGVYSTNTKANNLIIGLDGLKSVCLASNLPVVAIGGINSSNACSVMEIGVPNLKGVAVVSALFDRECISTETGKLRALLQEALGTQNGGN